MDVNAEAKSHLRPIYYAPSDCQLSPEPRAAVALSTHAGCDRAQSAAGCGADDRRPRRIGIEAYRAMELVEHATAYLADARGLSNGHLGELDPRDPETEALRLLLSARRAIYCHCPPIERRRPLQGIFTGIERRRTHTARSSDRPAPMDPEPPA